MKEEEPTQEDIIDAFAKASHHKRCRTLAYLYNHAKDREIRMLNMADITISTVSKSLKQIQAYLVFRCKQTCAGREGYQGKLKHESDCPAYDLGLVDS